MTKSKQRLAPYEKPNLNKIKQNKIIKKVIPVMGENNFFAVMDAVNRRTVKILTQRKDIDKDNILLIEKNNLVAMNHHEYGVPCHGGTLADYNLSKYDKLYRRTYRRYRCSGAFFDTTNQVHTAGPQIIIFVKKHRFVKRPCIATTFVKRVSKGPGTKGEHTFKEEYKQFRNNFIGEMYVKGYVLDKEMFDDYSGTGLDNDKHAEMRFSLFKFVRM
jgi:hypothetical protein